MSKASVPELYGSMVFNDRIMKERLPKATYKALRKTIADGTSLELETANTIAAVMKEWAIEKGATHFTHWFQPMTGFTAEKHDSFITPQEDGSVLMSFSGKELIKGEPDASSFPSGGIRATFEARGYTAWDPSSPAFVKDGTLYIPTAFCSYGGESLDKKTPLLRSMDALNHEAVRMLRLLGNTTVKRVDTTVGSEQEYFLIDKDLYMQRKDLLFCGRTLLGAPAPKGQEMEDHYFGVLKPKVSAFMHDLDEELWKLGVPAKTKHNEVAPAQHELAPIFETANIAVDHNQLTMEMMKKVADRHNMACLLHEKPFEGINGSGKHVNWSIVTDEGENLLEPGKTPAENTQFLVFLIAVIAAVDKYAKLLRVSVASAGNDHRLGANEAPPAVISIFLGDELESILSAIDKGISPEDAEHTLMNIGAKILPTFTKDTTDRNRTSPFAFTGNKFEFRMVGSQDTVGEPNIVLNTIVAEAFSNACDVLEEADDFQTALHDYIKELAIKHQRITFNGNGYSREWAEEAARRGLPDIRSMIDAIPALTTDKTIEMFEKFHVFNRAELESRAEIEYEQYAKKINIEALTMIDMTSKQIIPAVMDYESTLADSIIAVESAIGRKPGTQVAILEEVDELLTETKAAFDKLVALSRKSHEIVGNVERARYFHDEVDVAMEALRRPVDRLEMIVDKDMWPMPSYGDMIFEV